ncbi:MAG TPA: hypothetical protein DEP48_01310 [Persephonella sp.]|uniref:Cytochrome C family protein n=1 Tax=Persephonella marina (strain DSM 14350 / EX-H1) TaxID=123214 RepID=C0QRD1_PERMH|nr:MULTISPECIES: cytochrome c3 family protein [Persephonella]ACO04669.1 cytochrome C family protein [Persephonella marina EX-H1]HCB68974.1 hypothetical protein [Persephonella sp.]
MGRLIGFIGLLLFFSSLTVYGKEDKVIRIPLHLKTESKDPIEIIQPYDNSIHYEDTASIVIKIDQKRVKKIEVITTYQIFKLDAEETLLYKDKKRKEVHHIKIKKDRDTYCKSINLRYGKNLIQVIGYTKDGKKVKKVVEIYLASPVLRAYKYPPPKYKEIFFHKDENEIVCVECHDMTVNEIKGVAFEDVTKSNCYPCHKKLMTKYEYKHAPARNWLCATTCHTGKTGRLNKRLEGKSKYVYPEPQGELCYTCHKKKLKEWDEKKFHHDPVVAGMCDKCHNPHASPYRYFLRKPVWYLCTTCHEDKILRGHIAFTFLGKPHPTKGYKDPSDPKQERELSCISCHEPHSSDNNYMLVKEFKTLCNMCHKK